jgi:hypothetical protein
MDNVDVDESVNEGDPLFNSPMPDGEDYTLREGSPAIDAGSLACEARPACPGEAECQSDLGFYACTGDANCEPAP